jgi:DNA-binding transcriptional regulator YiaG
MLNITDKQFHTLFGEAIASQDRDAYASDWALSSIWGDEEADLVEISALCGKVWDIAHLTVAEIRANVGLTQAEFATRYCIPFRTVQNWEYRGGCPDYVRLMLARLSGLTDGIL